MQIEGNSKRDLILTSHNVITFKVNYFFINKAHIYRLFKKNIFLLEVIGINS